MKFFLHEIKLWFKNEKAEPKSYSFLPNKVNVITGDATTGKTSLWSIIDYCLLSGKVNIANTINQKVSWYGISFTVNSKYISIARKSPTIDTISSDVFFVEGSLPEKVKGNKSIAEIKSILDAEFGISDRLRFPYGKELGKTSFNLTYRYFLLFNALTEDIIGTSKTYFDTTFFGKEEYDRALSHLFDLVIGVNDMENIKSYEEIERIEREITKIQNQENRKIKSEIKYKNDLLALIDKCKNKGFIEYENSITSVNEASLILQEIISNVKKSALNPSLFDEIDELNQNKSVILAQIQAIKRYKFEYDSYKKNLIKSADSLNPIEYLNTKLQDQLVDSYETKLFLDSLELSLNEIKNNLNKKIVEPLKIEGDIKGFQEQFDQIENKLHKLNELKRNYQTESQKLVLIGEIKNAYEQILRQEIIKPIDTIRLNQLNDEKSNLKKVSLDNDQIKFGMKTLLNNSIQQKFNQLNSLPTYKNSKTLFNDKEMVLQLQPQGELFPLETVGSKSNYMLMHLCFYLGLHDHIISVSQEHVPQFLFIDQPSIPYYAGKDNDDRTKLIDAFSLINSFIDDIVKEKENSFQILMVEHAPKEYWIENNLTNFHTVDEFINGKGLVPSDIYNS